MTDTTQATPAPAAGAAPAQPAQQGADLTSALQAFLASKDVATFVAYLQKNPPAPVTRGEPVSDVEAFLGESSYPNAFPELGTCQEIDDAFLSGQITPEEMAQIDAALAPKPTPGPAPAPAQPAAPQPAAPQAAAPAPAPAKPQAPPTQAPQ